MDTFKPIVEIRKKWLAEMRAKVKRWLEAKKTGEVDPQKAARYIKQNRAEIVAAAQDLIKSGLRPSLVPLRAQIAKMKAGPQTPQIQGDIARMEDRLQWLEAKCPPMDKFPPAVERKRVWEQFCRKQYGYIP